MKHQCVRLLVTVAVVVPLLAFVLLPRRSGTGQRPTRFEVRLADLADRLGVASEFVADVRARQSYAVTLDQLDRFLKECEDRGAWRAIGQGSGGPGAGPVPLWLWDPAADDPAWQRLLPDQPDLPGQPRPARRAG